MFAFACRVFPVCVASDAFNNQTLLNESSEEAHQVVALGLLARIFYASEPLGRSADLLSGCRICHLLKTRSKVFIYFVLPSSAAAFGSLPVFSRSSWCGTYVRRVSLVRGRSGGDKNLV